MKISYSDIFQVLLLQLADEGRGATLLGGDHERARVVCLPFLVGRKFPSVYLELPLAGDPFLDVTLLYSQLEPGTRIASPIAAGSEAIFDWFTQLECNNDEESGICVGFELDTSNPELSQAAVHFQPRSHTELVRPFFEAAGQPESADLYLDLNERMPDGWRLSFMGMFHGRPGAPLRVCGYPERWVAQACEESDTYLKGVLDQVGFQAYDDAMLAQASELIALSSVGLDFQFDIYPDGRIGDIFAIDIQFGIEKPEVVCESFESGRGARIMEALEGYGAADERWRLTPQAAFARALPSERDDGTIGLRSFTLMPQWAKARWTAGVLQPSKLYYAGLSNWLSRESESATTNEG